MDEPLSNLDAKLRVQTRAELIDLQRRLETTVVYVTHDQVEAMTMGHRIAVMVDGVLQQVGPPGDVYDRPANVFVAGFIGNPPMNLLDARVASTGDGGGTSVEIEGERVEVGSRLAAAAARTSNGDLVVGIRPEHLRIDPSGPLAATVTVVESLGHERHVVAATSAGQSVIVRVGVEDPSPADGETIRVAWESGDVHLFDKGSGERLDP